MNTPKWLQYETPDNVAEAACQRIQQAARKAISERGCFKLVLAGGSTPQLTYEKLAKCNCDWRHWQIYFGDERCLPVDHPERNSHMANCSLLQQVAIPEENHFPIPAELGPEQGSDAYSQTIRHSLPFDLVLLGMGEDGHTASLFPDHTIENNALVIAVNNAPKPPPERVSLTPMALNQCRQLLFLITGSNKRPAVAQWRSGENLPINLIQCQGVSEVLIDRTAAS
ncbi:MAG: 6-phosphogluconolactonase [Gammaproteobacteria bacterium]|nr:6-phosphogluconolactonase [Gammaproteobacteria bacterium]